MTDTINAASPESGDDRSLEELIKAVEEKRKAQGDPLLQELITGEARCEWLRKELRKIGVKVPPRILIDLDKADEEAVLLALLASAGKGLSISEVAAATGFTSGKMSALRAALTAGDSPFIIEKKKAKGLSSNLTLTEVGAKRAAAYADTAEGQAEVKAQAGRIAVAKASKA